jgi:sulfatase maturation enzyme AslB (radical SAM superfamily)
MKFSSFTFYLTEKCNFRCSYCFQSRGSEILNLSTAQKAVGFFLPVFEQNCFINFTGGEPLLVFDFLKKIVSDIQVMNSKSRRKIRFTMTTNGSLIDENVLDFLREHKFHVILSFDGVAQEISRKKNSFSEIKSKAEKILKSPEITLETNSVFTPQTVKYLSESMELIADMSIPTCKFALSQIYPWNVSSLSLLTEELAKLRAYAVSVYKRDRSIPVSLFRDKLDRGLFYCAAGENRMSLAPDGKLWGCYLFTVFFKERQGTADFEKYCFGDLDYFIRNHDQIYQKRMVNYSDLRMNKFYTAENACILCPDLYVCWACPVDAAFASSTLREIPLWTCQIKKIFREQKKRFWEEVESLANS